MKILGARHWNFNKLVCWKEFPNRKFKKANNAGQRWTILEYVTEIRISIQMEGLYSQRTHITLVSLYFYANSIYTVKPYILDLTLFSQRWRLSLLYHTCYNIELHSFAAECWQYSYLHKQHSALDAGQFLGSSLSPPFQLILFLSPPRELLSFFY